jgi:hypothetical protein
MVLEAMVVKIEHKLLKFKYPKLLGLAFAIVLAYWIFSKPEVAGFFSGLGNGLGYIGVAFAGFLFSFGFTTPFSIGMFITLAPKNIFLAAILGGFCAMLADLLIFNFVRFSFMDEFKRLERTGVMKEASKLIEYSLGHKLKVYLMYAFAGLIIASPLPDEAGVLILAGLTRIKQKNLAIISWIFNSLGIFVMLLI